MNALESFIASKPMGFITQADLPDLVKLDRLCPLLVIPKILPTARSLIRGDNPRMPN